MTHPIPPMTHELGRYWDQPDRAGILVDATHAILSREDWESLRTYNTSIPSGTYAGKMWRTDFPDNQLCWYEDDPNDPNQLFIRRRAALVV